MSRKCSISFESKYAIFNGNQIDINEYLSRNHHGTLKCIPGDHEMVAVRCTQRHAHFRHKHDCDVGGSPMTSWHAELQSNLPVTERVFSRLTGQF
jgi:hypothetical protein